ncbi:hypothetical protein [Terrilactibacillus laevilacticus]|uniref:hypothetical protein n=1 Tax=Terrilactibacillus laevilacticus TaxID=1380157 RepID=UPI00113FCB6E|nr:hypothetical protein [Terrilactibacillus laevilacticus]
MKDYPALTQEKNSYYSNVEMFMNKKSAQELVRNVFAEIDQERIDDVVKFIYTLAWILHGEANLSEDIEKRVAQKMTANHEVNLRACLRKEIADRDDFFFNKRKEKE